MKYDLRAYKLAMVLILFQLAIPVVSSIGIKGPLSGMTISEMLLTGLTSTHTLFSIGLGTIGVVTATRVMGLRTPVGAIIFVGAFQLGNLPLGATLSRLIELGYMTSAISNFVTISMTIVMLGGFIWLSSN